MRKKKYLIIYHKEDADGLVSAAIIYNYILNKLHNGNKDEVEIETLGTTYTELTAMINQYGAANKGMVVDMLRIMYDGIFMTDISFNESEVMKLLYNKFKDSFVWIDHHFPIILSSIKEGFDTIPGKRDKRTSAIGLSYIYCYGNDIFKTLEEQLKEIPVLFKQLAGYDSFNWEYHGCTFEECYNVNKGFEYLTKLDLNVIIEKVKYILSLNNKDDIDFNNQLYILKNSYYDKGKEIAEYEDEYWKNIIQTSGDDTFTIDGKYGPERKTLVLVMQGKTCSTFFKSLIDTDIRNVAVFKRVPNPQNDKIWNVSVYNVRREDDEEFHVGMYLKKRYKFGGGHSGCGGFSATNAQFNKIFKTHKI